MAHATIGGGKVSVAEIDILETVRVLMAGAALPWVMVSRRRVAGAAVDGRKIGVAKVDLEEVTGVLVAGATLARIMIGRRRMANPAICPHKVGMAEVDLQKIIRILMAGTAGAAIMVRRRLMAAAAVGRPNGVMAEGHYQEVSGVRMAVAADAAIMSGRWLVANATILPPHKGVVKTDRLPVLNDVTAGAIQAISPFVGFILGVAVGASKAGSLVIPLDMAGGAVCNLVTALQREKGMVHLINSIGREGDNMGSGQGIGGGRYRLAGWFGGQFRHGCA